MIFQNREAFAQSGCFLKWNSGVLPVLALRSGGLNQPEK